MKIRNTAMLFVFTALELIATLMNQSLVPVAAQSNFYGDCNVPSRFIKVMGQRNLPGGNEITMPWYNDPDRARACAAQLERSDVIFIYQINERNNVVLGMCWIVYAYPLAVADKCEISLARLGYRIKPAYVLEKTWQQYLRKNN